MTSWPVHSKPTALAATIAHQAPPPPTSLGRGSSRLLNLSTRPAVLPRGTRDTSDAANVAPRFHPVRVLGRGGLGEVTLVHDNDIDRPVALKRLLSESSTDELVHRFAEEIRIVGQLEHPNIAPVHDVGVDDDGQHYFVMRYIEGESLDALIKKLADGDIDAHRQYTFERRVELFLGILRAVQYAHARGIIHRDIKPANVMVGACGEVLLMDWGIAKKRDVATPTAGDAPTAEAADDLFRTRVGSIVGTPAYMSPEQATGQTDRIDERSDVYSLCVLLYELLSLQHYLPGRTTLVEMLSSIADAEHVNASRIQQPSPHQSPVPAELGWYIEKGLAKDPADRYQSVAEMLDTLHRLISGQFAVQCPVTLMKRVGGSGVRYADRHPLVSMIGAASLVLLVGFAVFELVRTVI